MGSCDYVITAINYSPVSFPCEVRAPLVSTVTVMRQEALALPKVGAGFYFTGSRTWVSVQLWAVLCDYSSLSTITLTPSTNLLLFILMLRLNNCTAVILTDAFPTNARHFTAPSLLLRPQDELELDLLRIPETCNAGADDIW